MAPSFSLDILCPTRAPPILGSPSGWYILYLTQAACCCKNTNKAGIKKPSPPSLHRAPGGRHCHVAQTYATDWISNQIRLRQMASCYLA